MFYRIHETLLCNGVFQNECLRRKEHGMLLSSHDISEHLKSLNRWHVDDAQSLIFKEWTFGNFRAAMGFFAAVCELAERADHHPAFMSNYTKMRLELSTHDAKGLTLKDFQLALQIDALIDNDFSGQVMNSHP